MKDARRIPYRSSLILIRSCDGDGPELLTLKEGYEEMKQLGLAKGRDSYLSIAATLKGPIAGEY